MSFEKADDINGEKYHSFTSSWRKKDFKDLTTLQAKEKKKKKLQQIYHSDIFNQKISIYAY